MFSKVTRLLVLSPYISKSQTPEKFMFFKGHTKRAKPIN
jgi:hypothetical protein